MEHKSITGEALFRNVPLSIGAVQDCLFVRNIRLSNLNHFKEGNSLITRPLLCLDESLNIVTSAFMDTVYGFHNWEDEASLPHGAAVVRSGMFKDSLIWGDVDLQFTSTDGKEVFYIPFRIVWQDKYEAMCISNSWMFEKYSHSTDDTIVVSLEYTEWGAAIVPHMKRATPPATHSRCPDSWLPRHVIIYEDIKYGK